MEKFENGISPEVACPHPTLRSRQLLYKKGLAVGNPKCQEQETVKA
jgi:hypothetical protein